MYARAVNYSETLDPGDRMSGDAKFITVAELYAIVIG